MGYRFIYILLSIGIALPSRPEVQTQKLSNSAARPVVSLCEVLQFPAKYDSHEIVTSGVTGNSFHQAQFFDPECSLPKHGGWLSVPFDESYKMGQSTDKKFFKMLRKEGAVWVQLRGRFVATGGPFGPEGAPYEFVILEIVAFHKLSKVYREHYSIGTGRVTPD
jgi:hypothetical protein